MVNPAGFEGGPAFNFAVCSVPTAPDRLAVGSDDLAMRIWDHTDGVVLQELGHPSTVWCTLGLANGVYAVCAIGSMMGQANAGRPEFKGVRMGLWGAAQGVAFGLGGLAGSAATDIARILIATPGPAYATVFACEALLFLVAARMIRRPGSNSAQADVSTPASLNPQGSSLNPQGSSLNPHGTSFNPQG